jgi:signal transduction histidine kinase
MAGPRTSRKPTFFWQGMLILLPVAVLAAIGWASLRQDKILAEHDARERAQTIADDFLQKFSAELTATGSRTNAAFSFVVDPSGGLIFPPAWNPLPTPQPLDGSQLDGRQTRLWQKVRETISDGTNGDAASEAVNHFIASGPPGNFAAAACYDLGLLLARQNKIEAAMGMFDLLLEKYPEAVSESGLSFQPLAQFRLLDLERNMKNLSRHPVSLDAFYSNVVWRPGPLTPYFLGRGPESETVSKWRRVWNEHQAGRELFLATGKFIMTNANSAFGQLLFRANAGSEADKIPGPRTTPNLFWFTTPAPVVFRPFNSVQLSAVTEQFWLAVRFDESPTAQRFVCHSESDLGLRIKELATGEKHMPEYFGIGVEVAGRKIREFAPDLHLWTFSYRSGGKGGGGEVKVPLDTLATNVLASAIQPEQLLKVNVYLTSPEKLYQRQGARVFWFGSLVAVSAAAALIGLLAAWRAFRQQLHLSEMKSNFVSSVSHELRAPIASVRLMAENLAGDKIQEPRKQKEYFGYIVQECRRLSALIENVLDFSRIEQGRKQYEFEPTDVVALVQTTVKLMEPYAMEKGVVLKLETSNSDKSRAGIHQPTTNIEMEIDGRAIQQALVNLMDNAIKHSPKGETVTVGLEFGVRSSEFGAQPTLNSQPPGAAKRSEDGSTLNLFVSDHGPGIPPEEREKIFERFYRRGSELRRETQGVGIGLSIVKHIIEAHDGRVLVQSAIGQGSRFIIELPTQRPE